MTIETTRRGLFKGAMTAAAFAALPASIQKAFATSAAVSTGTIKDVKHIVILMQENRSFEMYYGTKVGARGFGDPFPASDGERPAGLVPEERSLGDR